METILFLGCTDQGGALGKGALEALGAARELANALSAPLVAGVFGEEAQGAGAQLAGSGAARCLAVTGPDFAAPRYATDAAAAEALARASGATLVVAPSCSRLARVLPGVAHRLGGSVDTHATSLGVRDGAPVATRWFYRQRMEATIRRARRPWIVLAEPGCAAAHAGEGAPVALEALEVKLGEAQRRTRVLGVKAPQAAAQTIRPDAKLLFVAGAGWTKKQADGKTHPDAAEELILGFLDLTKASLGSSKSLVDQSGEGNAVLTFMTHLNQVGQTGATPRHPKGLATCCHGEEPHVVGWRFVTERRAVNLDPGCGWARGKADVLYVADAFEVMAKVNALLGQAR